jgi:alpha-galactosidase
MTYGISLWLPYYGTGTIATRNAPYYGSGLTPVESYPFWSDAAPSLGLGIDMRVREIDYAALRRLVAQWRQVSPNYYGDFYPLTPWNRDDHTWMAWQFDRPEQAEGMVQAFRRHNSVYESARFKLRGLNPESRYRVSDFNGAAPRAISGHELVEQGLQITLPDMPAATVLTYQEIKL